jgi:hypothetical protein
MALPFDEFVRDIRHAASRSTIGALAEEYREAVSKRHRVAFEAAPVGSMEDLGPSIIATEVWGTTSDGFFWGTPLGYARDHARFREAALGEPLLYADPELADIIFAIWTDAVFSEFA